MNVVIKSFSRKTTMLWLMEGSRIQSMVCISSNVIENEDSWPLEMAMPMYSGQNFILKSFERMKKIFLSSEQMQMSSEWHWLISNSFFRGLIALIRSTVDQIERQLLVTRRVRWKRELFIYLKHWQSIHCCVWLRTMKNAFCDVEFCITYPFTRLSITWTTRSSEREQAKSSVNDHFIRCDNDAIQYEWMEHSVEFLWRRDSALSETMMSLDIGRNGNDQINASMMRRRLCW